MADGNRESSLEEPSTGQSTPTVDSGMASLLSAVHLTYLSFTSESPEANRDILESIHVTIEEIKSAQKVLRERKWYSTDQHGRQIDVGERMGRILRSVEDCAKLVDVATQHGPEVSSLVWAGARFILMVGHFRMF